MPPSLCIGVVMGRRGGGRGIENARLLGGKDDNGNGMRHRGIREHRRTSD